jgi:hypothetical protein
LKLSGGGPRWAEIHPAVAEDGGGVVCGGWLSRARTLSKAKGVPGLPPLKTIQQDFDTVVAILKQWEQKSDFSRFPRI